MSVQLPPTEPSVAPAKSRRGRPNPIPIRERLLIGLDDVACLMSISRRNLERLRSSGRFPQPDRKVGKRVLWQPTTVIEWVSSGEKGGGLG
jgi:predicted DNA-binding transcriptional regulator AlpA